MQASRVCPTRLSCSVTTLAAFYESTLPPTLLRRINVALIQRAHESVGEPIIFAAMDFLSNSIHQMQIEFIKEQRAKEMEAEQLRMRREVGHDIDAIIEAQDESGGKLGRRQKAKLRTAEKAFNHNDIVEQEEQERLKRQEERLERIRSDQCSLRVKRAQRAVEEREKARIQEEAERASRAAMNAAFNRGESIEEARAAAKAARKRSLRENGEEVSSSDDEGDLETANKSGGLDGLQLMNGSIPKDNNEGVDETKLLKKKQPALASNSTPATMAFMERLRKCYDDAVREKARRKKIEESVLKQTADVERDVMETGYYHFSDPAEGESLDAETAESRIDHIPTPVPVPTGDLAVVMKDVIQLQNEQPWLISSEARAPTVHEEDVELTTEQRHGRDEISKKLKEELTRKHKAADSWAKKDNNTGTKVNGKGGMPQLFHEMRSQRERYVAPKLCI